MTIEESEDSNVSNLRRAALSKPSIQIDFSRRQGRHYQAVVIMIIIPGYRSMFPSRPYTTSWNKRRLARTRWARGRKEHESRMKWIGKYIKSMRHPSSFLESLAIDNRRLPNIAMRMCIYLVSHTGPFTRRALVSSCDVHVMRNTTNRYLFGQSNDAAASSNTLHAPWRIPQNLGYALGSDWSTRLTVKMSNSNDVKLADVRSCGAASACASACIFLHYVAARYIPVRNLPVSLRIGFFQKS